MSDKTLNLVRYYEIPAYERIGWVRRPDLEGCLSEELRVMEWKGNGEAVIPFRIAERSTA